jgi:O-succinylbenzoate synthase
MGWLTEVCRVARIARDAGVRLWAGTMPESGLGSQAALAAAALPGCVFPSDLEPSSRWFGPGVDVIELRMAPDGTMEVPAASIAGRLDDVLFRRVSRRLH